MNELSSSTIFTLHQLASLLDNITDEDFTQKLEVLSGNTIGKHTRHIIELFQSLFKGIEPKLVDYDKRERNIVLETDKSVCVITIQEIIDQIIFYKKDFALQLRSESNQDQLIKTSYMRELLYNQEHAIHHMAIIGIVVKQCFGHVKMDPKFGVASSTIKYQEQIACAQ